MPPSYTVPGVYIEEIRNFPPSVAQVETAIPAFIGYTEFRYDVNGNDISSAPLKPVRIQSLTEYETLFGRGPRITITGNIELDAQGSLLSANVGIPNFYMYDSLRLFYANGGGDCYIVSVGDYDDTIGITELTNGVNAVAAFDEPTILYSPDAVELPGDAGPPVVLPEVAMGTLYNTMLQQCNTLKDRVALFDLRNTSATSMDDVNNFRDNLGINFLSYGMAYTPWLRVALPNYINYTDLDEDIITWPGGAVGPPNTENLLGLADSIDSDIETIISQYDTLISGTPTAQEIADKEQDLINAWAAYKNLINRLNIIPRDVPPGGAVLGTIATVDRNRGVWKAPANVSLTSIIEPSRTYSNSQLGSLNIDVNSGKSINAIRTFTGKGTLIWGARTLAGNDNEWRYVPVRRFFNMVEESVKKAIEAFVFEPNSAPTWVLVRSMIENFLTIQWRDGALAGAKPEQAFFVKVGLGQTMTAQDINEGRMIVEIGMAVVRPAEFIILRFSHMMQEA